MYICIVIESLRVEISHPIGMIQFPVVLPLRTNVHNVIFRLSYMGGQRTENSNLLGMFIFKYPCFVAVPL